MEDLVQNGISKINFILSNHYISTALLLVMVLYSGMLATKTFNPLKCIFENKFSRIFLILIILISFEKNKAISIMAAITIILSLQGIKKSNFLEKLSNNVIDNNPNFKRFYTNIQNNISKNIVNDTDVNDILKTEKQIQEESNTKIENVKEQTYTPKISEEVYDLELNKNVQEEVMNKTINNDLAPISRVLVEEKIKEQVIIPENKTIPTGNETSSHSDINYVSEKQESPLNEQINNVKDTEITNNNTKSSRGLNLNKNIDLDFNFDGYNGIGINEEEVNFEKSVKSVVNKKCNLCDQMKSKNEEINISAYQGEQLAEF